MMLLKRVEDEGYEIQCSRCSHKSRWFMRTRIEAVREAKTIGWSQTASGGWLCPEHTKMLTERVSIS